MPAAEGSGGLGPGERRDELFVFPAEGLVKFERATWFKGKQLGNQLGDWGCFFCFKDKPRFPLESGWL